MDEPVDASAYDADFSHAMLVAVLVKLGGSIELDATDLTPDALGNAEGVLYRAALEPLAGNRMRLSVVPVEADARPDGRS